MGRLSDICPVLRGKWGMKAVPPGVDIEKAPTSIQSVPVRASPAKVGYLLVKEEIYKK